MSTLKTFEQVVIDSRQVKPGDTFVAIRGERLDGHHFISDAIARGATTIVASRPPQTDQEQGVHFMVVPDTLIALGDMAREKRKAHPIPLVGITGSCGKTSVKGMLGSILSQAAPTLVTQGNKNNQFGMPLTLLQCRPEHAYAVLEMGATRKGDIAYLCDIAKPTVAVITLVAPGHLNGFGTIEGVATGKSEIYASLPEDGTAILNLDEPFHTQWKTVIGERPCVTFGLEHPEANVRAARINLAPFAAHFDLQLPNGTAYPITLNMPGRHMVMNALAASAAAVALGIAPEHIVAGLQAYAGTERRLALVKGLNGAWIIDDSYNANPVSMRAAIEVLAGVEGEKILIMGDMLNLGPDSDQFHQEMGSLARARGIHRFLGIGSSTALAAKAFGDGAQYFSDKAALISALKPLLQDTSVVLVKGSLSMGMAEISDALMVRKEGVC